MANDMDTKDGMPLAPLHATISTVSGGDAIKQRQAEPRDTASTMKDGHLVVARLASSGDAESLVGQSMAVMPTDEEKQLGVFRKLTRTLWKWGIETHGCVLHDFAHLAL